MKRILILSDSLSLARIKPEVCSYKEVWPELLKLESDLIFHQVSIGGGTSSDLLRQAHYHTSFDPNIIIIQFGLVDCAPRFASRYEIETLRKFGVVGKIILKTLNNKRIIKIRKKTYVGLNDFNNNLLALKKIFENKRIISIGIAPAQDQYEYLLPGIKNNIHKYNEVLKREFEEDFLDLGNMSFNGIMTDYHHLNGGGHEFIFKEILKKINA